jgi:glycosyltransferase involved in cell wall biosynthesis
LALMEATTVTGPAKNLFEFIVQARRPRSEYPAGVQISIVTFLRKGHSPGFIDAARALGIRVDVINEERAFQASIGRDLARIVDERKPDVIQSHNVKSHFLIRKLGLYKRRPWVAFHHGYTAVDFKDRLYNQLNRWSLRAADRVVAVCGPFAEMLVKSGIDRRRVAIRHNMVRPYVRPPEQEVTTLRERFRIDPAEFVIFSAGRLSREKGHVDLVAAVDLLRGMPGAGQFRVIIAGEGPERSAIERVCAERKLGGIVELVGHQPNLNAWYAIANAMVLPSHSEGSPNVLLEALAAGLPTVATAVGGVPEIATDGVDALLTQKGDREQMAAALQRLITDRELRQRLGAQGRLTIQRFTPEAYCEAILALYGGALRERRLGD